MVGKINVPNRTLFIGNNLEALRGIDSDSVELIYLDPPGNTGKDYKATERAKAKGVEFKDTWTLEDTETGLLKDLEMFRPELFQAIKLAKLVHGDSMVAYLTFIVARLVELERILTDSGSIYLHSNPGVSPYLRTVMDSLFGAHNFRNEITWKIPSRRTRSKRWLPVHDTILFYTAHHLDARWNQVYQEHFADYWTRNYRYEDESGRFQAVPLIGRGLRGGDLGDEWRGIWPGRDGNHWSVSLRALREAYPERDDIEALSIQEKLDLLDAAGLVRWPRSGKVPRQKMYADMAADAPVHDVLTTVDSIGSNSRDRTGWPQQKPESLLDLIIRVSSDPDDVVLDPFCGSGTTCVVAERLGRQWIGMEKAPQAEGVLRDRLEREFGDVNTLHVEKASPPGIPDFDHSYDGRTDDELAGLVDLLYAAQESRCRACRHELPLHLLKLTQVLSFGQHDTTPRETAVLLCLYCADLMGGDTMEHLELRLYSRGVLKP